MTAIKRLKAVEAAAQFVNQFFSNCDGAILAGSVVRGEETDTSDLDIVVFDKNINSSYRESLIEFGWPIEVFVHNLSSYKHFFEIDYNNAKPSMQRMIAEGLVIKDKGILDAIKEEAKAMLEKGPERWTDETIRLKRYFITDVLDDFVGCQNRAEGLFIANTLATLLHEFVLRINGCWIGTSKWMIRALKQYDEKFAADFVKAFDDYYQDSKKGRVIDLTDKILEPYGGRLFEGFSMGKEKI